MLSYRGIELTFVVSRSNFGHVSASAGSTGRDQKEAYSLITVYEVIKLLDPVAASVHFSPTPTLRAVAFFLPGDQDTQQSVILDAASCLAMGTERNVLPIYIVT
jgi:hypothetical protein